VFRIAIFIVMILAIALGLLVGTLNHQPVVTDLLWIQLQWPLGLVLLAALAMGLVIGLVLTWMFATLPLRMQLKKASRRHASDVQGLERLHD